MVITDFPLRLSCSISLNVCFAPSYCTCFPLFLFPISFRQLFPFIPSHRSISICFFLYLSSCIPLLTSNFHLFYFCPVTHSPHFLSFLFLARYLILEHPFSFSFLFMHFTCILLFLHYLFYSSLCFLPSLILLLSIFRIIFRSSPSSRAQINFCNLLISCLFPAIICWFLVCILFIFLAYYTRLVMPV